MALITQIQINDKGYLDLTEDVQIPLTYPLADIVDFSRSGSYSKTIRVPGTPNNNKVLGQIYDVNIANSSFNPNKKEAVTILKRGVPQFEGYLQLLNIVKTAPNTPTVDAHIWYELAVKDDTGNFYSNLNDKRLEDLSGFTRYNHTFSTQAIFSSSANTWINGYTYKLKYNLRPEYNIYDFQPDIYAKVIWDRIWNESGYSYKWDSLSTCHFDKALIPFCGDVPQVNIDEYKFKAGHTNNVVYGSVANGLPLVFDNDSTNGFFDSGNTYDHNTGIYTADYNGQATFKVRYGYTIKFYCPVACRLRGQIILNGAIELPKTLHVTLQHHTGSLSQNYEIPVANSIIYDFDELTIDPSTNHYILNAGYNNINSSFTNEFSIVTNVQIGQQVQNWVTGQIILPSNEQWFDVTGTYVLPPHQWPQLHIGIGQVFYGYGKDNLFYNLPSAQLGEGMEIDLKDFLPRNIKVKDFVSSVVKMNNLYITKTEEDKVLKIQTRDEFYNSGGEIDWTKKIATDREIKIEHLPDLMNKKYLFKYKSDSDDYNEMYTKATGEIYSQLEYTFTNNDWVKDTKEVELVFSPTPLVKNAGGLIVPAIDSRKPNNNIRFLYDGGWISGASLTNTWTYRTDTGYTQAYTFSGYSYAGHFDHPLTATTDFSFGLPDYLYYNDWETYGEGHLTENNLFNLHYRRQMSQIETGKLMTAYFRLNEFDILNLNFANKIWIFDTYWYLNAVIDYDANSVEGLTQVELISIDDGTKFIPSQTRRVKSAIPSGYGLPELGNTNSSNRIGSVNNLYGEQLSMVMPLGENITIQSNSSNSLLMGSNINFAGRNSVIIGSGVTAQGENIFAFGINNQTIKNSNTTLLGTTIQYVNLVSAGRDQVLNLMPQTKLVNFISAGRDSVRPLGSNSIETHVSAGRVA